MLSSLVFFFPGEARFFCIKILPNRPSKFGQIAYIAATSSTSLACISVSCDDKNSKAENEIRQGIFVQSKDSVKESGDGRYCDQILMV